MTRVSGAVQKKVMTFVKRRRRARTDVEIIAIMDLQARVMAAIDMTRKTRGVSVERFAQAAGITQRTYFRALSGLVVVHASTLVKLRRAQRQAAAGALA
jgi:hypothetical protein